MAIQISRFSRVDLDVLEER